MKTTVLNHQVKSETSASDSRSLKKRCGNLALGVMLVVVSAGPAVAGPTGGEIVAGEGMITTNGRLTQIDQATGRIAINWDTFNVATDETVRFVQPGSTSVALNTIFDQNPSQIFGTIEANGRVLLINPNGLIFSPTAQVNVAGLVASSLSISTADFMAGNYTFEDTGAGGMVLNQGTLQAAPGGFIALLGNAVANEGLIVADAGTIAMGAGNKVALDFDGSGLIYFEVESDVLNNALGVDDAVRNSGSLVADGGQVLLTAKAAQDVFTRAINNEGLIQARRIDNQGGVIRLSGGSGTTINTGTLDASGDAASDGGSIHVTGNYVGLSGDATVTADGGQNGGQVLVGGGYQGNDAGVQNAERTYVGGDVNISANAGANGDGGEVIVWGNDVTRFYGNISATGGSASGNGGFAEVSGLNTLGFFGMVDVTAANGLTGTLLLDPTVLEILGGDGGGVLPLDGSLPVINFGDGAATDFVSAEAIEGQAANVLLQATDSIIVRDLDLNGGDGDITMANANVDITLETRNSTVDGDGAGTISFDDTTNSIVTSGTGSITITAGTVGTAGGTITNTGILTTAGGSVNLTAAGDITVSADINSNGGAVNITADDNATIIAGATIAAGAGNVTVRVDNADDSIDTLAVLGGITSTGTVTLAGSANDVLQGSDNGDTWVIDGANTGTLEGWRFNDFASLLGGASADGFSVTGTGSLSGSIDGAGGTNSLDVSAAAGAVTVSLANDSATPLNGGAAGGFSNIGAFTGDNAADTLIGPNGGATFNTSGVNDGTVVGVTYTDFANITGGDGADIFNLNHDVTGSVNGGDNADTFNLAAGVVIGGSIIGGGGGTDDDELVAVGGAGPNAWTVTSDDAGTLNGQAFSDIENLTGNGNVDNFDINAGVTGTVDGGDGDDRFNLTYGVTVGTLTGGASGSNGDTLALIDAGSPPGQPNDWVIDSVGGGSVEGQAFSGMENLIGNAKVDVFAFTVNDNGGLTTLDGGGGDDEVTYAGAAGPVTVAIDPFTSIETLTGSGNAGDTLQGTAGGDAFTVDGLNSGTAGGINYFDFENLDGLAGNDTFTVNAGGSVSSIIGGADNDTVIGDAAAANAFVVNGANAGTVNGVGFSGIENLTGGGVGDVFTFNVNNDGGLTTLDGGGGDDEVTYAGATGPVTVAVDRFTSIETLTGSGNAGDTLQGTAGGDAFTVDGLNSGTAGGINYFDFENLDGLAGNDTFTVNAGGSVSSIIGGADNDTVIGDAAAANAFVVNGANAGTVNGVGFSGIENLTGGGVGDVFSVLAGGSLGGAVSGQGGDDELNVAGAAAVIVNLADSSATVLNGGAAGGFSSIESFVGDNTSDTLIGPNGGATFDTTGINDGTVAGFTYTDFANITGGDGADTFNLDHDVTGSVNGGDDADTFYLAAGVIIGGSIVGGDGGTDDDELVAVGGAGPNAWTVTSDDAGTLNGQAFSDIENLTGNGNVDNFDIDAVVTGTVAGLDGNDVFDFGGATGRAGFVDGGAGTDSMTFASRTTGVIVDMANVDGVESLTGSTLDDEFNINGNEGNGITIAGGGGTDTVAVIGSSQIAGDLIVTDVDAVSIGADLDVGVNDISLTVDGAITQSGAGGVLTAQSLTTSTVGGQTLDSAVGTFTASNSGSGDINLTNTGDLVITSINQTGGSVLIDTDGALSQTGGITSSGGDIRVTTTGGNIVMAEGVVTRSNGGDITYETTGTDADITLANVRTCDDCSAAGSTGDVIIRAADGSILGYAIANQDDAHITGYSVSLIAGEDIGTEQVLIKLRRINAQGNASNSGEPIFLEWFGSLFLDNEFGIGIAISDLTSLDLAALQNATITTQLSATQANADQAATQGDIEEVDWAAYSEDITLYEINNEGVQLPEQEEVDDFAKIDTGEGAVPIARNQQD